MELLDHLQWRYATKVYSDQKVTEDKITKIVEAINLSASSCGIQPYRVFVISNHEIKAQLAEGSFNGQIEKSSHLIVFAAFNRITSEYITEYVQMIEQQRQLPEGGLNPLKEEVISHFSTQNAEQNAIWASKQAYIGLGTALIAAAQLKVDTTPMEGFDPQQFDKILGLTEKGLHAAVILSLGYRNEESDYLANAKKIRLPIDTFSTVIS
ncbi:nitroreductase family protein [Sphingobacterium sp.]|uniref:nitroreductase family protein n=1 Tax=Sphingobacterium sp. TaxID=341027 RepID=UPI002898F236|nr:nitroreductase family protein [Sphingobacterium sp.]